MNNLNVKKGDTVVVLSGEDKGKTGKVLVTSFKKKTVIVENINIRKKHKKARSAQDTGGIVKESGPVDVSNVQIICDKCNKATRVKNISEQKDKKTVHIRVCGKCGASLEKAKEAKEAKKAVKKKAKAEKTEKTEKEVKSKK